MYSNIENVNILTALLVAHQVSHAVVCPGSRNAPIIHNLDLCESINCYPVTDERSAGFFALGLILAIGEPVAVCVTSGSALLNLAPAVAEAHYQHLPLIVISADRPEEWIEQLDGQTLRQPGSLAHFVNKMVALPCQLTDETSRWHCNRLVNEALLAAKFPFDGPVHINIPIAEPLFDFSVEKLPDERVIHRSFSHGNGCAEQVAEWWLQAKRPMIVLGQCGCDSHSNNPQLHRQVIQLLSSRGVCLAERLCRLFPFMVPVDEALQIIGDDIQYQPDFILYCGDTMVSKRLKAFLRKAKDATTVMVSSDGEIRDVTMHADEVVEIHHLVDLFEAMVYASQKDENAETAVIRKQAEASQIQYHNQWKHVFDRVGEITEEYEPIYSQMAAVRYFEQQLEDMEYDFYVHYANSSAVRLANIYAEHPVFCNRGVNGIEGSLSTAAGFSAATNAMVFCVIGDLSFFYDQNALWNQNLNGNLRIILLNNGEGGIFQRLNGLQKSKALHHLVSGAHHTSAQGICTQNDIGYLHANDLREMQMGIVRLLTEQTGRPILLEVFTDATQDALALTAYNQLIQKIAL